MRNLEYKNRVIRMNDKTWLNLKEKRKRSGLSWNLFLVELIKKNEQTFKNKQQ